MFKSKKALEERLKEFERLEKTFKQITGEELNDFIREWGNLEHKFHSKMDILNQKEALLTATEKLLEEKIVAAKAIATAECKEENEKVLANIIEAILKKLPNIDLDNLNLTQNNN